MARKKRRGWWSATRHCPPGHHWDRKQKRCVRTRPRPTTTTTTTTTPAAGLEPVAGTITPAVAQGGDTGVAEAPPGGDMTGTASIQEAVFSQGSGFAPQYHYDLAGQQQEATAQQMITQPEGE